MAVDPNKPYHQWRGTIHIQVSFEVPITTEDDAPDEESARELAEAKIKDALGYVVLCKHPLSRSTRDVLNTYGAIDVVEVEED
ncbi:MAG: hypothetical protein QUV05_08110 [Phycisphaerae bacterium]|nr:hypothetical protein [Phycisphaerae bacterium]